MYSAPEPEQNAIDLYVFLLLFTTRIEGRQNTVFSVETSLEKFLSSSNCLYLINSKAVSSSLNPHFSARYSLTPPCAISRFVCAEYICISFFIAFIMYG